jgi:hypothetical protein
MTLRTGDDGLDVQQTFNICAAVTVVTAGVIRVLLPD